jgi:MoaA/NifB/PqqE/SkfB family radical SAM enzyme
LLTHEALRLIQAVRFGGCKGLVFAGGDPSLRADIDELVARSQSIGLKAEIQTNADHVSPAFRVALLRADLIGLSLDASVAGCHDMLRGRPGNFDRTLALLRWLCESNKPVVVRSVVLPQNRLEFAALARLLSGFTNILRWSVLEFSAIGEGYAKRDQFSLASADLERAILDARESWHGSGGLDIYRNCEKAGAYLLLTPSGLAYGTTDVAPPNGVFPTVGSIIYDHLADLARSLPFSAEHHRKRYAAILE